jgi:hypothetical protein
MLATPLSDAGVDGAWWPHSVAIARELPDLIEALADRLGHVVDIGVNWSTIDGVLDLDALTRRGAGVVPGYKTQHQRVMTVVGEKARANLLVVPCGTSAGLATIVMRRAARLPILSRHLDTPAYRVADEIVRAAASRVTETSSQTTPLGGS